MSKVYLKQHHITERACSIATAILLSTPSHPILLYGVPRGGIPAAYAVAAQLQGLCVPCEHVDSPEVCHVIIDDIIDSGATRKHYAKYDKMFYALYDETSNRPGDWLVFPWEVNGDGEDTSAYDIPLRLMEFIGEDVTRGGLRDTPKRFIQAWEHWSSGYKDDPEAILKVFEDGAEDYDEMVIVKDIPVYSQCEHHLAPFFGVAHIGYIPGAGIAGLSKLSRVVDIYSRRLQVQERLTMQIATTIEKCLQPRGVAVVLECRHLCMESRGIQRQGSTTITSAMRGLLMTDGATRSEFMHLCNS